MRFIKALLLLIVGIVACIQSNKVFKEDTGLYVSTYTYGGDAYTGMQNAAAKTGQNVKDLAKITQRGFGGLLLVLGLGCFAGAVIVALPNDIKGKPQNKDNADNA